MGVTRNAAHRPARPSGASMGDAITALARFEEAKRLALQAKQPWGLSEELLHGA